MAPGALASPRLASMVSDPATGMAVLKDLTSGKGKVAEQTTSRKDYWYDVAKPSLLHRSFREDPIVMESTHDHYLRTADGREILDGCGGAAVSVIGQGNQEVISAIMNQLNQAAYVHTMSYTTPAAEALAELLVGHRPGGLSRAYFAGSGSEAMDAAMKMARQYFFEKGQCQRKHFIARRQSYHGNTFGGMSVSKNVPRLAPYTDILLRDVSHVSPCYPYQFQIDGESTEQYVERLEQELEDEFQRIGPDNVIAFVAETVGGATSGCISKYRM